MSETSCVNAVIRLAKTVKHPCRWTILKAPLGARYVYVDSTYSRSAYRRVMLPSASRQQIRQALYFLRYEHSLYALAACKWTILKIEHAIRDSLQVYGTHRRSQLDARQPPGRHPAADFRSFWVRLTRGRRICHLERRSRREIAIREAQD